MLRSMTAFASAKGSCEGFGWAWELRSVNGRGLDMRLRVPDWIEGLELALRARMGKALTRGNVTLSLRLQSEDRGGTLALNPVQLDAVITAAIEVENLAGARGLHLAPATATDLLGLRGVLEVSSGEEDTEVLSKTLIADFNAVLAAFLDMRASEGAALEQVLSAQMDEIARLTEAAAALIEERREEMAQSFRTALARVTDNADTLDEGRIAQEIATIAVKADVTEEIDRLRAHVAAARELLSNGSPAGRKLDFLSQEFNREANTLCSKAQFAALTTIGLELKTVIDQMREQVQNVE